jgi:hypothetical protein
VRPPSPPHPPTPRPHPRRPPPPPPPHPTAPRCGDRATVRWLLDAGAKPGLPNKRLLTPLGEALAAGAVDAARELIARGADTGVRPHGCVQWGGGGGGEAGVGWTGLAPG